MARHRKSKARQNAPNRASKKQANSKNNNVKHSKKNHSFRPVGGGDLLGPGDEVYFGEGSMMQGSRRPGRAHYSMKDEALDTQEKHSWEKKGLRNQPVEFVKAREKYNPSEELIKMLAKKEKLKNMGLLEDVLVDESDGVIESNDAVVVCNDSSEDIVEIDSLEERSEESNRSTSEEIMSKKDTAEIDNENEGVQRAMTPRDSIPDDQLFFVDETADDMTEKPSTMTILSNKASRVAYEPIPESSLEFNPVITIGKVQLTTALADDGTMEVEVPNKQYHPFREYIANVMDNISQDETEDEDFEGYDGEDYEYENHDIAQSIGDLNIGTSEEPEIIESEENSDAEPEFGFLEEDFMFDISKVEITNMRLGICNQYYTKSYTFFGDYDHHWIDEDLLTDFVLENGIVEHRVGAYLKYIKDLIIPPREEPEPTYSDINFSDTSEEEEEIEDLGEDLDDLVAYHQRYQGFRDMEVDTTSIETRGRGKKKTLILPAEMDTELQETLQGKFATRIINKAQKARDKQDFIEKEFSQSKELKKKYPYGMHVGNFKDEFDEFLKDGSRQSLAFPPLDPHGNKTVMKLAGFYNMKSRKLEKGLKMHVVVIKNKRTGKKYPDYNSIAFVMKQRPVFLRIDQKKRPKELIEKEKQKLSRRGGETSGAHVREGDIVGADAPEIDKDNIGRKLLEKMGWTKGEGLGVHGNKGIAEPVLAKVKKNKRGLMITEL